MAKQYAPHWDSEGPKYCLINSHGSIYCFRGSIKLRKSTDSYERGAPYETSARDGGTNGIGVGICHQNSDDLRSGELGREDKEVCYLLQRQLRKLEIDNKIEKNYTWSHLNLVYVQSVGEHYVSSGHPERSQNYWKRFWTSHLLICFGLPGIHYNSCLERWMMANDATAIGCQEACKKTGAKDVTRCPYGLAMPRKLEWYRRVSTRSFS